MVPALLCCLIFGVQLAWAKQCQMEEYRPEFTECDKTGRWLVWVPDGNCTAGTPPYAPKRYWECDLACTPGMYMDLKSDKGEPECKPCEPGTYSRGSARRFDNWTSEFFEASPFTVTTVSQSSGADVNCSSQGWRVQNGKLVAAISDSCSSELTYSAKLTRSGYVRFYYQYTDASVNFDFESSNGKCYSPFGSGRLDFQAKLFNSSDFNHYDMYSVMLTSGVNILRWSVNRFSQSVGRRPSTSSVAASSSTWQFPVIISAVEISGLPFVPECTKCPAGTYSKRGNSSCMLCERDQYSAVGSDRCLDCPSDQYAEPGWSSCRARPQCTEQHYFKRPGECISGKAEMRADWILPKVCVDGISLPPPESVPCRICNSGMTARRANSSVDSSESNTTCDFCPEDRPYSNGELECTACPPNTVPQFGIAYNWFNELPAGMHTYCASVGARCPDAASGWQPAGSFIRTVPILVPSSSRSSLGDYFQLLVLHVDDGFIIPPGINSFSAWSQGENGFEYGRLTVEFNVYCAPGYTCELTLSESRHRHSSRSGMLGSWKQTVLKKTVSFPIRSPSENSFTFAFNYNYTDTDARRRRRSDDEPVSMASIFSITLTNAKGAGATDCKRCENATRQQCVPCSDGQYMRDDGSCVACPPNSVSFASKLFSVVPDIPRGIDACVTCSPGLRPDSTGSRCVLDCSSKLKLPNANYSFDLTAFTGVHAVASRRVFSPQGQAFFYVLNFTVCQQDAVVRCVPPASNITDGRARKRSSIGMLADPDDEDVQFGQQACYVTVLPNILGTGAQTSVKSRGAAALPGPFDGYYSPLNLGMTVESVIAPGIDEPTRANLSALLIEAGFEPSQSDTDVFIVYESLYEGSETCPDGRHLVLALRCDVDAPLNVTSAVELPPDCPEGTCDGCVYVAMWRSRAACPVCDPEKDVRTLLGECIRGQQTVYYQPAPHCYLSDSDQLATRTQVRACPYLPLEAYIVLGIAAVMLVIAFGVACSYRSKTRKLQYKYMRLVQQAGGQYGGELAGAESCAVQEGEELDESVVDEDTIAARREGQKRNAKKKNRSGNGQSSRGEGVDNASDDESEMNVDFKNMKLQPMRSESGDGKVSALSRIIGRFKNNEDRGSSLMDDENEA